MYDNNISEESKEICVISRVGSVQSYVLKKSDRQLVD